MNVGFAMCGSFCTFSKVFPIMELLTRDYWVTPVFSDAAYSTDTRFGKAAEHIELAEEICGTSSIHTIVQAEPIGPKKLFDILVIAPCTGNTLAKLAHGITDTPVTMACKAHMRNDRPLILSISTNDGLGLNAQNLGRLLSVKNIFFVPFGQDDFANKPNCPDSLHCYIES